MLNDSATSPGDVTIVGTNGDTITVTFDPPGFAEREHPGLRQLGVGHRPHDEPDCAGVTINTGANTALVEVMNTTTTNLTITNGTGNTIFYLASDSVSNGLVLMSGDGNNQCFLAGLTVLNGLMVTFGGLA